VSALEEQLFSQEETLASLSSQLSALKSHFSEGSAAAEKPRLARPVVSSSPRIVTIDEFELGKQVETDGRSKRYLGYEKGTKFLRNF
jgi:hypothetical protein